MDRFIYEQAIKDNYVAMHDLYTRQDCGKTYINICNLMRLANEENHNMSYLDMQKQELRALEELKLKYKNKQQPKDFWGSKPIIYKGI